MPRYVWAKLLKMRILPWPRQANNTSQNRRGQGSTILGNHLYLALYLSQCMAMFLALILVLYQALCLVLYQALCLVQCLAMCPHSWPYLPAVLVLSRWKRVGLKQFLS